jgi:dTDP-3-amino-3,4,6-trideoxy-alpha-D-glucose transaminase
MILQNDFKRQWSVIGPKVSTALERVGASGWYILGQEVSRFEAALAEYWGVAHAVGVGNGMDALEIGLRCLGLEPGAKVLTTPFSAFASTLAILRGGGVPVFVDVDDSGNLDLEQCREALQRDRSIRFLLPVHLYGNPVDLEKLAALQRDFDLLIVEDCAQAIGAAYAGHTVGTIGQAAATSFYPTKNLGALGDAGALLTNDPALAERARTLRNYGQSTLYFHSERGLNTRLDELQAAILHDALLPRLREWTERRTEIAKTYRAKILHSSIRLLPVADAAVSVWHLFPVFVPAEKREAFQAHLASRNIKTGIHYPRIIPDQEALRGAPTKKLVEPINATRLAECELSLPVHPFLTTEEISSVIAGCNEWPG